MKNYCLPNSNSFGDIEELHKISSVIDLNKEYEKGGIPLYSDTKRMLVNTSDTHTLITGATGSRKTRSVIYEMILNIAKANEKQNMVIHEPKEEINELTYRFLKEQGYDVYVINFRNPSKSDHYNFFDSITNLMKNDRKKAKRKLGDICTQLFEDQLKNEKDSYWLSTVCDYFAALYEVLNVISNHNKKYVNIINLIELHRILAVRGGITARAIKDYLKEQNEQGIIDSLNSVLDNAQDTKKNLMSMVNNPFNVFESISNIIYKSDFTPKDLATKPVCLFLVTPDESDEYNFMISLIVKQLYSELIDIASTYKDNTLPVTVNFIIDEFGSLPKIDSFNSMISAARSRNIRFHLVIQTFSQLREKYNDFGAVNIFNNCGICICMRANDYELEALLKKSVGNTVLPYTNKQVPLIFDGFLRCLEKGQALILAQGVKKPIMVRLPDISEYDCYKLNGSSPIKTNRQNSIAMFDFENFARMLNIDKPYAITTEDLIQEFKKNEDLIEYYQNIKKPTLITEYIDVIPHLKYDIVLINVTFGKEYKLFKTLLEITNSSEKEVAEIVMRLSKERERVLLRLQNKTDFISAVFALESLGKIFYESLDPDDSNNSSINSKKLDLFR